MITQHGPKCDVCGDYILPLDPEERVNFFSSSVFPGSELHCDNKCKKLLENLPEGDGNWKNLPDGPIRKAFEKKEQKMLEKNLAKKKELEDKKARLEKELKELS